MTRLTKFSSIGSTVESDLESCSNLIERPRSKISSTSLANL